MWLLAAVALFVFVLGAWDLFYDPAPKLMKYMKSAEAKVKAAKSEKEGGDVITKSAEEEDKVAELETEGCLEVFFGCLGLVGYLFLHFGRTVFGLLVMITALTSQVGQPVFGYLALVVLVSSYIIGMIRGRDIIKEMEIAKLRGEEYVAPPTSQVLRLYMHLTTLYMLYVFLVQIGIFA